MQLYENKVSKNVDVLYKTRKPINSKCLRSIYFSFIHSYIDYANVVSASTNKNKLKNYFGTKNKLLLSYLTKTELGMPRPLLKTLNALNFYQINLLQVPLFMQKIKTNSSPRIFLHQIQTIKHK